MSGSCGEQSIRMSKESSNKITMNDGYFSSMGRLELSDKDALTANLKIKRR